MTVTLWRKSPINKQKYKTKIAEVIEASSAQFTAQSYELYALPPLGSLVRAGEIYAVVCHAATGGIEPGRRPSRAAGTSPPKTPSTNRAPSSPSC